MADAVYVGRRALASPLVVCHARLAQSHFQGAEIELCRQIIAASRLLPPTVTHRGRIGTELDHGSSSVQRPLEAELVPHTPNRRSQKRPSSRIARHIRTDYRIRCCFLKAL